MSLTITLSNDLEQWLELRAHSLGTSPESLVARTVEERFGTASRIDALPARESQLLLEIQSAFPADETTEFHELCRRSDAGTLSESDRPRYRELIYRREDQNASRLKALAELADLRGMSLDELMDSLQIVPQAV